MEKATLDGHFHLRRCSVWLLFVTQTTTATSSLNWLAANTKTTPSKADQYVWTFTSKGKEEGSAPKARAARAAAAAQLSD